MKLSLRLVLLPPIVLAATACHRHGATNNETADSGVAALAQAGGSEAVRLIGTRPSWGGTVVHGAFTYITPASETGEATDPGDTGATGGTGGTAASTRASGAGRPIPVARFSGTDGISFSGSIDGRPVVLAVSVAPCADGMSDRTYPLTATLMIGGETRLGCAWTASRPFRPAAHS